MPIYEYSCEKCGKTIEIIQKMSDKPLRIHAGCGGKLTKLISAAGFQFKGTGWYVTDYARKSGGNSESSRDSKPETPKTESAAKESKESTTATSSDNGKAKPPASGNSKSRKRDS